MRKKIFTHGGSKSVDELSSMESDLLFAQFIDALHLNALKHPEKLKSIHEVWDDDWQQLLEVLP